MILRQATSADLDMVLDVQERGAVRSLSHIFPQDRHPFPRDRLRDRWAVEIADPTVRAFVITDDGHVRGFVATRDTELLHFGTDAQTWGSGLAVRAHAAVLETFAEYGAQRIWLRVFEDNRRARRFYEKLGWEATGERATTSFPPHPVLLTYTRSVRSE